MDLKIFFPIKINAFAPLKLLSFCKAYNVFIQFYETLRLLDRKKWKNRFDPAGLYMANIFQPFTFCFLGLVNVDVIKE